MVDILQFYKETTERPPEDQILEKFNHAGPPDTRTFAAGVGAVSGPGMYPQSYTGRLRVRMLSEEIEAGVGLTFARIL
jgi:p21-activated kinase 1